MSFIIFDTEYIADKGMFEEGFNGWKNREIIQIAAIKVSENLLVEDKLNFYTLPTKHPSIPKYFVDVTGITDDVMLKNGINFVDAYKQFCEFADGLNCYSHGWGGQINDMCDGEVLEETLSYYQQNKNNLKYYNIAPWFKYQYEKNGIDVKSQASGEIASILNLQKNLFKLGLNPHNAFYDVFSILEGLKFFGFKQSDIEQLAK